MADWFEDLMNLDLNLGPASPGSGPGSDPSSGDSANVDVWEPPVNVIREFRHRTTRQRWRWRQVPFHSEERALRLAVASDVNGSGPGAGSGGDAEEGGGTSQVGEGSVAAEERNCDEVKGCECNLIPTENENVAAKEDVEKSDSEEGSFYDCNICFDLAKEPVVTCCGHLFCWPCIYRWLNIYSDAKECPVCKGEVTLKNVTPIFGRGNHQTPEPEEDSGIKIPVRPSARRVESLRQTTLRSSSIPMEEMIRRLGARFELTRDFFQLPDAEGDAETLSRSSILNRLMTSRALRREQASVPPEDVVDLTQDRPEGVPRRLPPLTYRRGQSHRSSSSLTPPTAAAVEAYLRGSPPVRSQELQPSSVDDRDSFSSIVAVIHGESQAVDTAVDSLGSLSTSSSRRRHDAPRGSDMDSGDSRAMRRRRLN